MLLFVSIVGFKGGCVAEKAAAILQACKFTVSEHTLHLAAQFLKGLRSGLVIVWELLPGGNGVGAGAVRQAALRGALVPGSLLLPVQVVLYEELQLWGERR